jgi:hypothetical protein
MHKLPTPKCLHKAARAAATPTVARRLLGLGLLGRARFSKAQHQLLAPAIITPTVARGLWLWGWVLRLGPCLWGSAELLLAAMARQSASPLAASRSLNSLTWQALSCLSASCAMEGHHPAQKRRRYCRGPAPPSASCRPGQARGHPAGRRSTPMCQCTLEVSCRSNTSGRMGGHMSWSTLLRPVNMRLQVWSEALHGWLGRKARLQARTGSNMWEMWMALVPVAAHAHGRGQ